MINKIKNFFSYLAKHIYYEQICKQNNEVEIQNNKNLLRVNSYNLTRMYN